MKDTHETNLPAEETGKLEETKAPEVTPENTAAEVETTETPDEATANAISKLSKEEILEKLAELVNAAAETARNEVESLKQAFYKIHRAEVEESKKTFLEGGGEEKDFVAPEDEGENKLKELLAVFKEKRAAILAEEERIKAANYALKLQLIDQLKVLTESQDDFNKLYNDFKDIQQRWKEIKAVPQEHANELWKNYQTYSERFYDIIKINNQFRDYDFKKNLELKTALCETVEKLQTEPDVVSAFHQLQKLHQQWREIGPVAKELREELWARFKAASTVINKRHQEHFESLKSKEQENLVAKTAICEEIEGIDFDALKTFKDWEEKNKEVIALQDKWKTIGFAPKKSNVKIFERFRAACDYFFEQKNKNVSSQKSVEQTNLAAKKALIEKINKLDETLSADEALAELKDMMAEWNAIGHVPFKEKDKIYKEYHEAVDSQFDRLKVDQTDRKMQSFRSNLNDMAGEHGKGKLYGEREKLMRMYDRMKNELQTYENNIGFLSISSKGGGGLVKEMERKIEKLKDEMALIIKKIDAIDENLE